MKEHINAIVSALEKEYPDAKCSLEYKDPLQLLIATRLAAQCTDARVNLITPKLFARYKTAKDFAFAKISEVESIIRPCGFFRIKAKDIVEMCKLIYEKFGSKVPDNMEELLSLPGVGRKTANLILGDIFYKPAVVVDTHCIRITRRLGLHNEKDPVKIEKRLRGILPPKKSNDFCHRLVLHGRAICKAISPKCFDCCLKSFCKEFEDKT
ncbi:MAG: endonuclease III [Clostridia bacterium]|nr:endonuclease III [Clostridia bacterium]